mmetsp:Transcript_42372/g.92437  ORF Transcript_42372/g.92437 Transcript_42372/m.92437 type:complete len:165 (+) Transcript_42372:90-584(+)|eukprot:CAMPEP_0204267400 /NCGR_PEP_ID=MMETSP0468-20130131/10931_1 /ASSEMBLY_ACC=CAM_ASM_000383 /TAXON_ID=2969 /ORGANISM="Oxyrrhis marina" /LENGTH=164 /DNA_ID=CAMNT_0051242565 /DNA_START=53 /DNA_END=547 /DNA_ORIENTATION=+
MRSFIAIVLSIVASEVADPIVTSWTPLATIDADAAPILLGAPTPLAGFGAAEPDAAAVEIPAGRIAADPTPLDGFGGAALADTEEVEIPEGRIASDATPLVEFGHGDLGAVEVEIPAGRITAGAAPLVGFGEGGGGKASAAPRLRGFVATRVPREDDEAQQVVA